MLVADIAANGLHVPIILFEETILDGRNRYRACLEAGVEPRWKTYDGDDPRGFVRSLNSERRDLTASLRAVIALKDEEIEAKRAKERQREGGISKVPLKKGEGREAVDAAGKLWGVSGAYVEDAKWISKQGDRGTRDD